MRLFYERGYDSTSLEDIAGELHVVKSLCYRYYDSKQTLFDAVLGEYTEECCRDLAEILHDRARPMEARMQTVLEHLIEPAENGRYHDFFHKTGNEAMGFVCPFKSAKESSNPLVKIANQYVADGKTPVDWCFATMPSEEWKNGVGSALTAYAAGTGTWDAVKTAFVDGWASEYKLANG